MCLYLNEGCESKVSKVKKVKKDVIAYKVMLYNSAVKESTSIYRNRSYKWVNGKNTSDRESTKLSEWEESGGSVFRGFHCFATLKGAKAYYLKYFPYYDSDIYTMKIYRVKINSKDIVAYGTWKFASSHRVNCLVCTKLSIDLNKPVDINR